ncbi:MAG: helix-turn-helix domain-containing protein [Actinomycetota bacterium]
MSGGAMFGSRLRKMRLSRDMTQKQLAGDRYTHAYVSSIEAGRRMPSRDALEHFASQLGVDVDELLTGRPPDLAPRLDLKLQEARIAVSAGDLEAAETGLAAAVKDARQYKLPKIEARAEEARGLLLERRGKPEDALEHYRRAETLLEDAPAASRADAVAGKARCFEALGDIRYAIHLLESLLDELRRGGIDDPDALARLFASLVDAYLDAGLYRRAAESAAELDRLATKLADPFRIATMHMNVARLYLSQSRTEDAERSLRRAEDAYRVLRLNVETGQAYLARGYVLSREERFDEARTELEQAHEIFEHTGDEKDLTRTLNELGRIERLRGDTDRAKALLDRSIGLLGTSDTPILAWAHRELALTVMADDPQEAEKHLRFAIELYERAQQAAEVAVTYRALGDLLAERGSPEDAADAYRTGILALEPRL